MESLSDEQYIKEQAQQAAQILNQKTQGWVRKGPKYDIIPIMSEKFTEGLEERIEPDVDVLCDVSTWIGREQFHYSYADFMFCDNIYPNNFLLTLRRFPMPVNDAATVFQQNVNRKYMTPIARMVTWMTPDMNKLEDILSFSFGLKWSEVQSEMNFHTTSEQGGASAFKPFPNLGKALGLMEYAFKGGGFNKISGWDEFRSQLNPFDSSYKNRVFKVNVIDKTMKRDRGLEFSHSIELTFKYSLSTVGGINPKVIMLDILANVLAMTYNNAMFWGGANIYFPHSPAYPFPGREEGFRKWIRGDVEGFFEATKRHMKSVMGNFFDFLQEFFTNPSGALKKLGKNVAGIWAGMNMVDPSSVAIVPKALLTGDPVGEWHLVVGNPLNPIMMIGNLIVTNTSIKFYGPLGDDDFPSKMEVKIKLEHGRPRDKGDIESMFNRGGGRLHYAKFGEIENTWNFASSTRDSRIDDSWKVKYDYTKFTTDKKIICTNFSKRQEVLQGSDKVSKKAGSGAPNNWVTALRRAFFNSVESAENSAKHLMNKGFRLLDNKIVPGTNKFMNKLAEKMGFM